MNSTAVWKYAPPEVMTLRGLSPVVRYDFRTATLRTPKDAPIKPEYGVLILHCQNGETRFYGFEDARINSELRMIVRLSEFHLRDEVIRKWEPAEVTL